MVIRDPRNSITIDSVAAVQRFRAEVWRIGRRRFTDVRVDSPVLSASNNTQRTVRLRSLYFACGCNEGKVASVLGLVGFALWMLIRPGGIASFSAFDIVIGVAIVGVAGLTGKFLALTLARRILARLIATLEADLARSAQNA
ncbi:MAG: hypothetical protein ACREL7_08060 [Longimicrobiales bacterium]